MKKVIIGCLGAAAIIAAIVAVAIWFLLFRELPTLDASLAIAPEVEMDSTVTLTITATNSHTKRVTLDSVDIDDSFLAGFQVVAVDPEPRTTTHMSLTHQRTWEFGKPLASRQTFSVTFTLRPAAPGHFSGDVNVCNPNQDFKTLLADVVVTKKSSNEPPRATAPTRSRD